MDEYLHIIREETVEKFVMKNERLQSFIGEFNLTSAASLKSIHEKVIM